MNTAIVDADITHGFDEYLAIFDRYYADDVAVSSDTSSEPLVGKERVTSALLRLLIPLHVMAEIGGLAVLVHETPIPSDSVDQRIQSGPSSWSA